MKSIFKSIALGVSVCAFSASAFANHYNTQAQFDRRALTIELQRTLSSPNIFDKTVKALQSTPKGIAITELVKKIEIKELADQSAVASLSQKSTNYCLIDKETKSSAACQTALKQSVEIPEVWMHLPKSYQGNLQKETLYAYPPTGNEQSWERIEAFDRFGNTVWLDKNTPPNVPVIVLETHGANASIEKVKLMNSTLRDLGLQSRNINTLITSEKKSSTATSIQATEDASLMSKIMIKDVQEPWIKGSAEIYMITSGVKSSANDPEIAIIPLNYLDDEETAYYPNQLVLFWSDYTYNVANIQFWEDDADTNYQNLVATLLRAVSDIGGLAGIPELEAVFDIASIIVEAMPSEWYEDNDDFVDSCYTLEKNAYYSDHTCAANNAVISLEPYVLTSE
ncbi:DUF3103 family protein [Marinibactrum halimedae]|uniref:DUF3103 family protein n=1 Tax=Marinibactrum halimedae TaxID=1444977 RepID=A0AA37T5Q0_9GAMM|nr:DUF3103 family protein [Marinibactrum halimedae]MCD9461011.1 DUF3103 domain-containing protein [Marinibactrum halimedae]GLS27803.1 hypothetical protein GCM10007877_35220 [Marinibactrum halimedae]